MWREIWALPALPPIRSTTAFLQSISPAFLRFNDPVPSLVRNQTLRFSDSWTWVHAKHTLTFGGEIRRIELNSDSNPNPRGHLTLPA